MREAVRELLRHLLALAGVSQPTNIGLTCVLWWGPGRGTRRNNNAYATR
jgi:hypothetical protein